MIKIFRSILGILVLISMSLPVFATSQSFIKVFLPGGQAITAELAISPEQRQIGLMNRDKINPDQGMLFLFEMAGYHSFWMKNMKFAIDILWLDGDKRIVHIEKSVPPCESEDCPSYAPTVPALYALELREGCIERYGLKLYQQIDFILPKD